MIACSRFFLLKLFFCWKMMTRAHFWLTETHWKAGCWKKIEVYFSHLDVVKLRFKILLIYPQILLIYPPKRLRLGSPNHVLCCSTSPFSVSILFVSVLCCFHVVSKRQMSGVQDPQINTSVRNSRETFSWSSPWWLIPYSHQLIHTN